MATRISAKPPLGLKVEKPAKRSDRPMRKVSAQKAAKDRAGNMYLMCVRHLPCVICREFGLTQTSPTSAHHPIHGRYSARKAPHAAAIPLCEGCHQGNFDTSKVAVHREPEKWKRLYGEDNQYIEVTQDRIAAKFGVKPPE